MAMKKIHISGGGVQRGPFTESQIQNMWNEGSITMDSLYWHEGMSEWAPITNLTEAQVQTTEPEEQVVAKETPSAIEQYAAEFQASTTQKGQDEQRPQKLSRKQKKQRKQQASTATGADQATPSENSGSWFGELLVLGGFLGVCYALIMFVGCPIVHWAVGTETPEGKYIHTAPLGPSAYVFDEDGTYTWTSVLFGGTLLTDKGEWGRSGILGDKIKTESDKGIESIFKYDEDADTLEVVEINGKAPPHKEIYIKMN